MKWWERRALSEHLEKLEAFGPLLDEAFERYGKSCRLVKYSQMFEKWTLGEIDGKTAIRCFKGWFFVEPDSFMRELLKEYIDYITNQETEDNKKTTSSGDGHGEEPEERELRQTGDAMENEPPDIDAEIENHILMHWLKVESNATYQAMKKALKEKLITYKDGFFDFHCDRGCVGLFFREGGCTEYKTLNRHILINGKQPARTTLENCTKNKEPRSWIKIKKLYFDTPAK
jgi:hypothetical protein